jgi:hypothetical protein
VGASGSESESEREYEYQPHCSSDENPPGKVHLRSHPQATFFDHIVSCTNCIAGDFKANENFITGMDNVIQSIGQVCRIAGFDIRCVQYPLPNSFSPCRPAHC